MRVVDRWFTFSAMKLYRFVFLICCLIWFPAPAQDAREIVRKADEKARGTTSITDMSMKVQRPNWSKEMRMKAWTKGNKLAMIQILSPEKERGIVYLKKDKEVWNWIPVIERNVKMPPSMMSQSWMGTDFTNDDLVKEFSIVEDYVHTILGEEVVGSRNCYRIELNPKPESAVVWGKVILWIDRNDLIVMKAEYFDEDAFPINRLVATEVKILGGRLLPSVMEMIPLDKKGQKTIITYHSIEFDRGIDDGFFTVQQMQRLP
jgi:outer membrane lipoprotein-sorting protein